MPKYWKAFLRNDGGRYNAFLEAVSIGEKQLHEVADTNVAASFELILDAAVRNNVPHEELPETLDLISDMEFNALCSKCICV